MTAPAALTTSVVIVTYCRPEYVRNCLEHLTQQKTPPGQIIVVDASPDSRTRRVVTGFDGVEYRRNELGRGTTPESRQIGLAAASGEIVAFLDDDAYAEPSWLDEILAPYADPTIAGVGGRADNGIPGEMSHGLDEIGLLLPDGRLTGNFGADPGRLIDVDHLLGANMSFRRSALDQIGGIRGNYPGTCLCEESDISLRLTTRGQRVVFNPRAVVRHVAGTYQKGKRFDRRYLFYARRNQVVLLSRVFGFSDPILRRFTLATIAGQRNYLSASVRLLAGQPDRFGNRPSIVRRVLFLSPLLRMGAELVGLVWGFPAAFRARMQDRRLGVATP